MDLVILLIQMNPLFLALSLVTVLLISFYVTSRRRPVYLIDHACFKPGPAHEVSHDSLMEHSEQCGAFTEESLGFQRRMLERSGVGQSTFIPVSLMTLPLSQCMKTAREEAETVIFGAVDDLIAKTGVRMEDIGVLVVNCSLFCPTPSLAAMIENRYGLPEDLISYNLSGMGCSAGLVAVDLVKHLLQVHRNKYALIVSTENMTLNAYFGNNRSMLLTNTLFRLGGAAILLSNRDSDRQRAKYQLARTLRTHTGAENRSYTCVTQEEDSEGKTGVALSKDLMNVAGEALKANITTLGPLVLPISEQLMFLKTLILKRVFHLKIKAHIPDFKLAFDHFCIHAGGRAVLDQLERSLVLSSWHMEPSRSTLYRFGNTSSSSLWYEIAYCEAKGRMKEGDRVWQIAFGSGFKCNSAVWRVLRTVAPVEQERPWLDDVIGQELPK